ncbi:MAG: hypothetical protein INR72_02375, partial [Williamsia herbipolensis]|nr:hypothetical protein [Williamsia herbipolensis]
DDVNPDELDPGRPRTTRMMGDGTRVERRDAFDEPDDRGYDHDGHVEPARPALLAAAQREVGRRRAGRRRGWIVAGLVVVMAVALAGLGWWAGAAIAGADTLVGSSGTAASSTAPATSAAQHLRDEERQLQ